MSLYVSSSDLTAFWIAFAIAAVLSIPILKGLAMLKAKQTVSQFAPEGHQVKQGTPTMGGFIILAGFFGALPFIEDSPGKWPVALLVGLFALIGFVDDFVVPKMFPGKRGLGWKQKILMQFVAAGIPLAIGGLTDPVTLGIGVIIVLFFANAYNFSDGLDGLAGTLLLGLLLGVFVMGLAGSPLHLPNNLVFVWLGALLPFLYWNAPKAKIFMGDVGSLAIGAYLGYVVTEHLSTNTMTEHTVPIAAIVVWSLMMVAELVPVPLQIASVKIRKKKLFPYTPIHHAFEKAGWPETRVVFVFAIVQLLCSLAAITIIIMSK
ncbi:MAG TPA: hypothetical protein VK171_04745 [Fimbriimonas sp.]|nr:hypothetical protein [Fimbriimonas sp.]